jgi:CheY-like chemotaxis protein
MAIPGKLAQVFVVEDNDPDVFLVEEALRSEGVPAQIQRCQDGEEAIRVLSQIGETGLPDIIIIDLNLPKVTGLDILKHVRSLKQLDGIPALILTSSQSKTDRALCMQFGANAYIAKPPTLPEFLSSVGSGIRALLERDRSEPRSRCHRRASLASSRRIRARFKIGTARLPLLAKPRPLVANSRLLLAEPRP